MLTNEELGKRIGVSPSMASRIRNGRRRPGLAVLAAISREFDVPLDVLVSAHVSGPDEFGRVVAEAIDPAVLTA